MAFMPKHDPGRVLHSPFDIETHKETFVDYLEVVISPDGVIEYAIPSHQGKLELICRDKGIDPVDDCPRERYLEYHEWLMEQTGYVMVWNTFYKGSPNPRQRQALLKLVDAGLLSLGK